MFRFEKADLPGLDRLRPLWQAALAELGEDRGGFEPCREALCAGTAGGERFYAAVLVDLAGETGRDAGFVAVSYDRGASCGRVEMLYLDPEYRGRGLGRQLLKMGLSCLEIHCIREKRIAVPYGGGAALRLCESFGFRPQRVECLLRP